MGGKASNLFNDTANISNSITQLSTQNCAITCANTMSNNTYIFSGGTGDITITQTCSVTDATCMFKTAFEANLQTIVESVVKQTASAPNIGFNFTDVDNRININTYIQNTISQIMNSSCAISATNESDNNYYYVQNHDGNFTLTQNGAISASTCSIDNIAKATSYTKSTADASQKATITNVFNLIAIIFIVLIIVVGIVAAIFLLTGGIGQVAGAAQTINDDSSNLSSLVKLAKA